jgi:copper chaperone
MIELKVKGMSCQHCANAVSEALASVPGVSRVVSVELDSGRALVEGDAEPEALASAVAEAGYEAEVV